MSTRTVRDAAGPFVDELAVGQVFEAPGLTLTDGHAAVHQAVAGDRLRLPLDRELSREVAGGEAPVAHPQLVCDVAIGQSTAATQRVIANLFYRGLVLRRAARIGDTLQTTTTVTGLKRNRKDPSTGLAVLRITTVDQQGRTVLDFHRCAMLPVGDESWDPDAPFEPPPAELPGPEELAASVAGWNLEPLAGERPAAGDAWRVDDGDVVTGAPELARLTLNVAAAHHAREPRLVYGGHTIALALAQTCRAWPDLVTVVAWHGCDHLAPVQEGDLLRSHGEVEAVDALPGGGALAHLRVHVEGPRGPVLDWRPVAVVA